MGDRSFEKSSPIAKRAPDLRGSTRFWRPGALKSPERGADISEPLLLFIRRRQALGPVSRVPSAPLMRAVGVAIARPASPRAPTQGGPDADCEVERVGKEGPPRPLKRAPIFLSWAKTCSTPLRPRGWLSWVLLFDPQTCNGPNLKVLLCWRASPRGLASSPPRPRAVFARVCGVLFARRLRGSCTTSEGARRHRVSPCP
jgi:hypothetical protein